MYPPPRIETAGSASKANELEPSSASCMQNTTADKTLQWMLSEEGISGAAVGLGQAGRSMQQKGGRQPP